MLPLLLQLLLLLLLLLLPLLLLLLLLPRSCCTGFVAHDWSSKGTYYRLWKLRCGV